MVLDALRGYVQLASGMTEVSRARALAEAKALLAQTSGFDEVLGEQAKGLAEDMKAQVQSLADDLVATSRANRAVLSALIGAEVDRAVSALGLATSDEVAALRRQVERLEGGTARSATKAPAKKPPAKKPATKQTAAKKPPAKKATTRSAKKATTPKDGA